MGLGWIFWSLQLSEKWQMRRARDEEEREGRNEWNGLWLLLLLLLEWECAPQWRTLNSWTVTSSGWAGRGEERVMGHLCLSYITNAWNKISCAGKVQRLGLAGRRTDLELNCILYLCRWHKSKEGVKKNVNLQRKHCQEQVAGWRNAGLIWLCDYHGTRTIY